MNCPYCNKIMEKGTISYVSTYYGNMFWVADGKNLIDCMKSKEGMIAKHTSILDSSVKLSGFYCCACKKIITDVTIENK